MNKNTNLRSGGQVFVGSLIAMGVDTVFCVPGESYLDILNALYDVKDKIRVITCRHEAGAAHMAEAYGKLTGKVGVCMVTRGPGACHASIGIHCAMQNSTPMLLVVGQVARGHTDREAFQEVDYGQMFGPVAKNVEEIRDASRIPEVLSRNFGLALSGRTGPVVLSVPEDMLKDAVDVADSKPVALAQAGPTPSQLQEIGQALRNARNPVMVLGGPGWNPESCLNIQRFAESWNLPVCCTFRRQDAFDNTHPNYCGHLTAGADGELTARVKNADVLLVIGARFDEISTQRYAIARSPDPDQTLIHVHPDTTVLGRVYQPTVAVACRAADFATAVNGLDPAPQETVGNWCREARTSYEKTLQPPACDFDIDPARISIHLRDTLDENAIITMDAGNFCAWPMRFLQWRQPRTQLASQAGAMGCAVPLAVSASLLHPDRQVVCFVGDGGFMMSGLELGTAVQYGASPICLVFNNGIYGTIRMHQEREYPGRKIATDLANPNFAEMAIAMGCHGERISSTAEFAPAFERALNSGKASVIEVMNHPELIKPGATLSDISG